MTTATSTTSERRGMHWGVGVGGGGWGLYMVDGLLIINVLTITLLWESEHGNCISQN